VCLQDSGPALLREHGLLEELAELGWKVEDIPDLDFATIGAQAMQANPSLRNNPNAKNRYVDSILFVIMCKVKILTIM